MRRIAMWTVGLAEKYGLERKAVGSTYAPVEIARPIFEQRIIRIPIGSLLAVANEGLSLRCDEKIKVRRQYTGFLAAEFIAAFMSRIYIDVAELNAEIGSLY
jgi:hypothetical protein